MDYDLDLDALTPEKKKVKLNGKVFLISQPDLTQLFEIAKLSTKMKDVKDGDIETIEKLKTSILELVPELKEERLSITQLIGLFNFIAKMVQPTQAQELERAGISTDITEKKSLD